MKTFFKYTVVLIAGYLAAWTASYAVMFLSRGEGLDFTRYFEYLGLGWTFSGGELPSFIWLASIVTFIPLAGLMVFALRRYKRRKNVARTPEDYRRTHKLYDVLSRGEILNIGFSDGRDFVVSACSPVDPSVYQDTGRWCCTVEQYLGPDEKGRRLFDSGSGVDILEQDITSVANQKTGEILYSKT